MNRQRLGQHFLHSSGWLDRIARTLPLHPAETWIEIGAGHGEMTGRLQGEGRRVMAIEMDPPLASGLRKRAAAEWPGVEVVESDALVVDFADLGASSFRVYGNLPYYITSPLIRRVFQAGDAVRSFHIVIQKEVAERIVATPGRRAYGFLSALCQFYSRPKIVFSIPPGAFRPPPRVASALVEMQVPGARQDLGIGDETEFLEFIQRCFGQKRKKLRNNLRTFVDPASVDAALELARIDPGARAEELPVAAFAKAHNALHDGIQNALNAGARPGPAPRRSNRNPR
jgi:16S rRNA (adenine1518-N6/adenine1519-N6)-dimethyltransferase